MERVRVIEMDGETYRFDLDAEGVPLIDSAFVLKDSGWDKMSPERASAVYREVSIPGNSSILLETVEEE